MNYDDLLAIADAEGIIVKEKSLRSGDGRIFNNRIAIRSSIARTSEKTCVLAEEIGHYMTTYGDITRPLSVSDQKQERRARMYGYDMIVGLSGIISAYESGAQNRFEMAEHLDVTEEYLDSLLAAYRDKYGTCVKYKEYLIFFEPYFSVCKNINAKIKMGVFT